MKKLIGFPFKIVAGLAGLVMCLVIVVGALLQGKSLSQIKDTFESMLIGLKATENEDDSIISLVEKHYGSGKAMHVSEILSEEE